MTVLLATQLCIAKGKEDRIITLLQDGANMPPETNLMLYYGRQLLGTPYVSHTLEGNLEEHLVVNIDELDCMTFVEVISSLTITTQQHEVTYEAFCHNLQRLRYKLGIIQGYTSRNHYFQWWLENADTLGIAREIIGNPDIWSARQNYNLTYLIGKQGTDRHIHGTCSYIPKSQLSKGPKELGSIQSGDIIAIVTNKRGLDTSHMGIAVWGEDNKLHLLHASSIYKRVIVEPKPLYDYMQRHPSQLGIRVVRVK